MTDIADNLLKPLEVSDFFYKLCHDSVISDRFDDFGERNTKLSIDLNKKVNALKLRLQCFEVLHLRMVKIYSNGKIIEANKMSFSSSSLFCDEAQYDANNLSLESGIFHSKREVDPVIEILFNEEVYVERIEIINFGYRYAYRAFSLCLFYREPAHSEFTNFFDNWKIKKQLESFINNTFITKGYELEKLISLFYVACAFGDERKAKNLYDQITKTCPKISTKASVKKANDLLALSGYGFNQHGFIRPFGLQSEEQINNHLNQVVCLMAKLEENFNIKSTISSGTLLGIYRDGKLIDHDDDIDLAYYSNFSDYKDIVIEQNEILSYMKAQGYNCQNTNHVQIQVALASGVDLDLFPTWIDGESVMMSPLPINQIKVWDVFPLDTIDFKGHLLPVPRNINKILEVNYGVEYKNSNSNWRFDWPRANKEYIDFIEKKNENSNNIWNIRCVSRRAC